MPKCGNCKKHHESSAGVLACYKGQNVKTVDAPPSWSQQGKGAVPEPTCKGMGGPIWPPSDKQVSYYLGLQEERLLPDSWTVKDEAGIKAMEKDVVSSDIGLLTTFPRKPGAKTGGGQTKYGMPAGRYALRHGGGDWRFYEVTKPTEGRWAGYTFIKRLIGAPGDYKKVDIAANERSQLLNAIDKDPKRAMVDYGKQSGVCGRCSSPLTDPASLARGIGPVCARKEGW